MSVRTTLAQTRRMVGMALSRATVREINDNNLIQEVKQADVFYSESPTNFERWQPVGLTAVPLKQQAAAQPKNNSGAGFPSEENWNHDQPTGPAAEAIMLYIGGSRSHPVAMVDDRRVRPYNMNEGEGAHYAPDGSEQMVFFNAAGAYLVSLDGSSVKDRKSLSNRMASLRHVTKSMQSHKIAQGQQPQAYKHEGESVNTEVRCTAGRIEFRAGDTVVGYYDKAADTWFLAGKVVSMQASTRFETVGKTYLGLDSKGEAPPLGETGDVPYKQTFVKLID